MVYAKPILDSQTLADKSSTALENTDLAKLQSCQAQND